MEALLSVQKPEVSRPSLGGPGHRAGTLRLSASSFLSLLTQEMGLPLAPGRGEGGGAGPGQPSQGLERQEPNRAPAIVQGPWPAPPSCGWDPGSAPTGDTVRVTGIARECPEAHSEPRPRMSDPDSAQALAPRPPLAAEAWRRPSLRPWRARRSHCGQGHCRPQCALGASCGQ